MTCPQCSMKLTPWRANWNFLCPSCGAHLSSTAWPFWVLETLVVFPVSLIGAISTDSVLVGAVLFSALGVGALYLVFDPQLVADSNANEHS